MKILFTLLPLFITAALLFAGNGLQGTLITLRASDEGFGTQLIGLMGMAYYAGFMLSNLYSTRLIKSFGHIRVFAGMAALTSAGSLALILMLNPYVWIVLRALMGFCFAGVFFGGGKLDQ